MDDVLDCLRFVHIYRDFHGCFPLMVPVLLRSQDSDGPLAALSSYEGILDTVQEVRASSIVQARTGKYLYLSNTGEILYKKLF